MTDSHTTADVVEATRQRISDALLAPFPTSVIEEKSGFPFIGHEYVRMRLIEATCNRYTFTIDTVEYRNDGAIRDRNDKATGEVVGTPVCVVTGTLTIPDLGSRSDVGVQEMQAGSGADSSYKGASSDCFKRCAMSFGVGLKQLYIDTGKPGQAALRQSPPPKQAPPANAVPDITTQTNDQFKQYVVERFAAKDIAALTNIVGQVGADTERGCLMVHATSTVKELDWLHKERDALKLAVDADVVREEMAKRQTFSDPKA